MIRCRQFLTRAESFPEAGKQESDPDLIAVICFFLGLFWFVGAGVFILQESSWRSFQMGSGMIVSWTNLFFCTAIIMIINCSLLIKSRNSFLFAGAGIGAMFTLYVGGWHSHDIWRVESFFRALPFIMWLESFFWPLVDGIGEQIFWLLVFLSAFLFALCLLFFFFWLQAGKRRIWTRRVLLAMQVILLTLSLLMLF